MNYIDIYRKFTYPIYHRLKRDGVLDAQKSIAAFVAQSPAERETAQSIKLKRLLSHAYANCPFYRKRFDQIAVEPNKLTEHFTEIPPLTKADIRENLDSIRLAPNNDFEPLFHTSTGGSTGEKLFFYFDLRCNAMRKSTYLYNTGQLGIQKGAKIAKLWGAPIDIKLATSVRGRLHSWITRTLLLSTYELSDENMQTYTDRLISFKPELLESYPSPLATFCDYLTRTNRRIPSIKYIVTSAEQLFDWQRARIESTFNCKVMNRYGSREFGDIAHEFPNASGLHVASFRFYLEILNDQHQPVDVGERGHIHVTDLDNYGMPFIRYRIEDAGIWHTKKHHAGPYGLPVIEAIDGRSFDVVEAPNGNRLGGTYWTILLRSQPGIKQFQVRQKTMDQVVINYVPDDDTDGELPAASHDYFLRQIREKCGDDMIVAFHKMDSIEQTLSGKIRLVISDLNRAPSPGGGES
jgi:phenylacetate-CoA ligase